MQRRQSLSRFHRSPGPSGGTETLKASVIPWIGLNAFILVMLALDLGVFHRRSRVVSLKESLSWTGLWVALALLFDAGIWYYLGAQKAVEFVTGYVIEKSLSIDNVFIFALLFANFRVKPEHQHKVLFWGVFGALLMRGVLIVAGAALFAAFVWVGYVFGVLLIVTGARMIATGGEGTATGRNRLAGWLAATLPMTSEYRGNRFFTREYGRRLATPLFLVLILVEISDLVFAMDSIPAIFAITTDPFIVYASNAFAILGLRSLYFALSGALDRFRYLKIGLGVVLAFVGAKMLLAHSPWPIGTPLSLGIIAVILAASLVLSRWRPQPSP